MPNTLKRWLKYINRYSKYIPENDKNKKTPEYKDLYNPETVYCARLTISKECANADKLQIQVQKYANTWWMYFGRLVTWGMLLCSSILRNRNLPSLSSLWKTWLDNTIYQLHFQILKNLSLFIQLSCFILSINFHLEVI